MITCAFRVAPVGQRRGRDFLVGHDIKARPIGIAPRQGLHDLVAQGPHVADVFSRNTRNARAQTRLVPVKEAENYPNEKDHITTAEDRP